MKLLDVLETVEWGMEHYNGVVTNRQLPLADMKRAAARGLVGSLGMVALCDEDGCTIFPERYREGWVLTEAGRDYLAKARKSGEGC